MCVVVDINCTCFLVYALAKLLFICRRIIYKKLQEAGVPVPDYAVLSRNEDGTAGMWIFKYVCACIQYLQVCRLLCACMHAEEVGHALSAT